MEHAEKVHFLQSIPLFQDLDSGELDEIARLLKDRTYPPNHTVIEDGQSGDSCYIIVQGKVAILKEAGDSDVLLGIKESGDFFGEMTLLESTTRSATVRTLQESHLLELSAEAFQPLWQRNVIISSQMAQELSRRLRDTDSKLISALNELSYHIHQRDQVLLPALAERTRQLVEAQEGLLTERERRREAYLDVTRAVVTLLEDKDSYNQGHSQRVAEYACQIAREMGWPDEELGCLEIAALLHDIGRLGVPNDVLNKKGELTTADRALVQRYPQYGVSIFRYLDFTEDAVPIIECHRERWDGQGYPHGLAGDEIPLGARILAVAEAYDAMLCERPYRPAKTPAEAMEILQAGTGHQWDPAVVKVFVTILGQASNETGY